MTMHVALYIKDILKNMQDAEQFIEGMTYEQFVNDKKRSTPSYEQSK